MKTLIQADREARRVGTLTIHDGGMRSFRVGEYDIEYLPNGRIDEDTNATNFYVRRSTQRDDMQSDYFAGSFHKTLTAAIRYARRASCNRAEKRHAPSMCCPNSDPSSMLPAPADRGAV